jgi:hexosaminidase
MRAEPALLTEVIPAPMAVRPDPDADFTLTESTVLSVSGGAAAEPTAAWLAELLRLGTGFALPFASGPGHSGSVIALELGTADPGLGDEGYTLAVQPGSVVIRAGAAAGLFHGAETLRQLLPGRVESASGRGSWVVAGGRIVDRPRYPWRGAMLDVARHFFSVADVNRYVDEIALYKINILHLHLSDDQGWRIGISGWPRLAAVGGSSGVGGGGGGHYTQEQYRQIVAHATSRHVTVVPEIDMPGHVNAALASYSELNSNGTAPSLYTGIDVGFSSLCTDLPVTYRFVDDVVGELAAMTPGPYIHIGGDEARSTSPRDYAAFIERAARTVAAHGKTPVGCAEIAVATLPPGTVVEYWDTAAGRDSLDQAARVGAKVVLAPANRCYLDQKYEPSTLLGLTWAGPTGVEAAYDWDPTDYGVPGDLVVGVEAPLFSETLATMGDIEQMAFPRLPGIAEIGWSPQAAHDWSSYRRRLAAQAPRWEALGLNFHRAPEVPWPFA